MKVSFFQMILCTAILLLGRPVIMVKESSELQTKSSSLATDSKCVLLKKKIEGDNI